MDLYTNIETDNLLFSLERQAETKIARVLIRRAASHVSGTGLAPDRIFFVDPDGTTSRRLA